MGKSVKVTIECDGITETFEGDSFIGAMVDRLQEPTVMTIRPFWTATDYIEAIRAMSALNATLYRKCVVPIVDKYDGEENR